MRTRSYSRRLPRPRAVRAALATGIVMCGLVVLGASVSQAQDVVPFVTDLIQQVAGRS